MYRFALSDRDCAEHSSWLDRQCPSTSDRSGHFCCPNLRSPVTVWHRPALALHLCVHICARHCPAAHAAFLSRITEIHSDKSWRHKTDRTQFEMASSKRSKYEKYNPWLLYCFVHTHTSHENCCAYADTKNTSCCKISCGVCHATKGIFRVFFSN